MILVTGANGTIGSHLVGSVVSRGGSVRVLVRATGKAQAIFGDRVDIVRAGLAAVRVAIRRGTEVDPQRLSHPGKRPGDRHSPALVDDQVGPLQPQCR